MRAWASSPFRRGAYACLAPSIPPACSTPSSSRTRSARRSRDFVDAARTKSSCQAPFRRIAVPAKAWSACLDSGARTAIPPNAGDIALDYVELPPLGRRIEWPTIVLAVVVYGLWLLATFFWREAPWWAHLAVGAWVIAWQLNL